MNQLDEGVEVSVSWLLMTEPLTFPATASLFTEEELSSVIHRVVSETKGIFHRSKLGEIFLYLSLVLEGYRDAYLFDGCSATAANVVDLLRIICDSLVVSNVRLGFSLVTIGLGANHDDFLVIGSNILQNKLTNLTHSSWIDAPLIVDVNGSNPRVCDCEEIRSIKRCLINTFSEMMISTSYFPISATTEFLEIVGFPFLAGWLLGYPCVYRSSRSSQAMDRACSEDTSTQNGNALSMITLMKYSVKAVISAKMLSMLDTLCVGARKKFMVSNRCLANKQKCRDLMQMDHMIDLMEFTVPLQCVHESSAADVDFRTWFAQKYTAKSSSDIAIRSNHMSFQIFTSVSLSFEEVELPSLVL